MPFIGDKRFHTCQLKSARVFLLCCCSSSFFVERFSIFKCPKLYWQAQSTPTHPKSLDSSVGHCDLVPEVSLQPIPSNHCELFSIKEEFTSPIFLLICFNFQLVTALINHFQKRQQGHGVACVPSTLSRWCRPGVSGGLAPSGEAD